MRRRQFVAAAGLVGVAGCLGDGSEPNDADDGTAGDGALEPPFEVETIDAPGSEAGSVSVPATDRLLVVNFARTRCPTSEGLLAEIDEAADGLAETYDVGTDGVVEFLTATDGTSGPSPSDDELAAWWDDHGGDWPVGTDESGALYDYYDVTGVPALAAIDPEGAVRWREEGATSAPRIVSGVERALEAAGLEVNAGSTPGDDETNESDGS